MKRLLTIIIILASVSSAISQWAFVSRPSGARFNSISVPNANVIWAACDSTKAFRSTDYGNTWVLRNSGLPNGNLYGISALDSNNCWIGTVTGSIYKTTNGGLNWVAQLTQSGSFTDGIKMFNANYGIYYADPLGTGQQFQLRYTTNGGTNWTLSPNSPTSQNDYGVINAWDWIDTGKVWVGAANATPNATSARIFRTTAGFGGGNWATVTLPGSGTSDGLYWQAIAFTDANNGLAGTNGGNIRRTTDGGATWQIVANPPGLGVIAVVNMHGFKDGSNLIRMSTTGQAINKMFRTTNLGASWTEETLPAQGTANAQEHIQFFSQTLGYAGCLNGFFLRFGNPSSISLTNTELPDNFRLEQNFPNPFNPSTKINFSIPNAANVTLKIYDINGKEVSELLNQFKQAGNYSFDFVASPEMNSGMYFYTLKADNLIESKKFMLIK
jgi:photosystem II stability/assembly factor-like uncharacterized protein